MSARSLLKYISGIGAAALIAAVTGIAPAQAGTDPGSPGRGAIAGTLDPAPRVHLMPTRSVARSMSRSFPVAASPPVHLAYFGGPVMYAGTQTIPIFWEPPALQDGTPEAVDPHYNELIQRFLEDVGGHGLYNNLTQYYEVVGGHKRYIVNSSGFLQAIVDTTAYPSAAGSCAANSLANCITDTQIQTEIANVITSGSLPVGYSTMYMVFTDPLEASCVDDTSCFDPVPPGTNWKYCAYHSVFFSGGQPVIYANMPYLASNAASISGCAGSASHPNNVAFDDETSALSHEFNEAITDPIPDDFDLAWYDLNYGEIGDICNQETARVTWGSNTYIAQKEWSNATNSCVPGGDDRLSLSVRSGPGGTSTKVKGREFLPNRMVTLSFSDSHGKRTSLGSTKSNGSGSFAKVLRIPGRAHNGLGTLGATGATPGGGASASFSVSPAPSSYRPDAMIAPSSTGPWIGGKIYNVTGSAQTLRRNVTRGRSVTSWVKIQNRGNVVDTFTLNGPSAPAGFTVAYVVGSSTKTEAVEAGTYGKTLRSGAYFFVKVMVRAKGSAAVGSSFHVSLLVSSLGKASKQDAVVASMHAR